MQTSLQLISFLQASYKNIVCKLFSLFPSLNLYLVYVSSNAAFTAAHKSQSSFKTGQNLWGAVSPVFLMQKL